MKQVNAKQLLKYKLPQVVRINENFTLDESFDIGTIFCITSINLDGNDVYEIKGYCPKEYYEHNFRIAHSNWYDHNSNPTLKIYELFPEKFKAGDFYETLYVSEDKCFDVLDEKELIELQGTDLSHLLEQEKAYKKRINDLERQNSKLQESIWVKENLLHKEIDAKMSLQKLLISLLDYIFVPKKKIKDFLENYV